MSEPPEPEVPGPEPLELEDPELEPLESGDPDPDPPEPENPEPEVPVPITLGLEDTVLGDEVELDTESVLGTVGVTVMRE